MSLVERGFSVLGSTIAEASPKQRSARKWPISYRAVESIAIACDVATIFLSSTLSGIIYQLATTQTVGDILQYVGSAAIVAALFLSLMIARNLYDPAELLQVKGQICAVAVTWTGVFLFSAGVVFALKIGADFSRGAVILFAASGLAALAVQRIAWHLLLRRGLASERFSGRDVILISEEMPAPEFIASLAKHGFEVKQQFIFRAEQPSTSREDISQLVSYLHKWPRIEEVLISGEIGKCSHLIKRLSQLRESSITVSFIPIGTDARILRRPSRPMGDTVCIELQRKPLTPVEIAVKRLVDVVGASIGLIALLPLLMITAIAIRLDSPGPILFRQRRRGFNGSKFSIVKFRTMSVLEDGNLMCQAARDDCRVTRVGRWLRRTSIDELPQLWNVLTGNMSLVGPRPHALVHDTEFDKLVRNYAVRHHVKPGLTGWAQVHGCRGPTPTPADVLRRVEFDLWYIDNWNFRLDCVIILRTVIEVLRGHNAY
jgi:putative colanic acid biosynthesis UDP-glucose lipid carrier transferase